MIALTHEKKGVVKTGWDGRQRWQAGVVLMLVVFVF